MLRTAQFPSHATARAGLGAVLIVLLAPLTAALSILMLIVADQRMSGDRRLFVPLMILSWAPELLFSSLYYNPRARPDALPYGQETAVHGSEPEMSKNLPATSCRGIAAIATAICKSVILIPLDRFFGRIDRVPAANYFSITR